VTFIRNRKTGEHAVDAWKRNYSQLEILFTEVPGFEEFMVTIARNTLRDSIYGTVYRVSLGAFLSTFDGATDLYVISTYYESEELIGQANALMAMVSLNMLMHLIQVNLNYGKKSTAVKAREMVMCILFLKPAVDAYRVSTNYKDNETTMDPLSEMICNKAFRTRLCATAVCTCG